MDEVALNVPILEKIVSEIEGLAESGGKYVEAPSRHRGHAANALQVRGHTAIALQVIDSNTLNVTYCFIVLACPVSIVLSLEGHRDVSSNH